MVQKKVKNYGLYQTLSSTNSNDLLLLSDKIKLPEIIKSMSYEKRKAVFMLIYEHARLNDEFQYNFQNEVLPYSIVQDKNDILIDFLKLPDNLQFIIYKFSKITN
jgi:hypothetical protein